MITLEQRLGETTADVSGQLWETFDIGPKLTDSIKISIQSVYESYEGMWGIIEIMLVGEDTFGFKISTGHCSLPSLIDVYDDLVACQKHCRQNSQCKSFVYVFSGSDINRCELKSAKCDNSHNVPNNHSMTFTLADRSDSHVFAVREGYDENSVSVSLAQAGINFHYCFLFFSTRYVEGTGFAMYSDQSSNSQYKHQCKITNSRQSGGISFSQSKAGWYYFERIDLILNEESGSIGCYGEVNKRTEGDYLFIKPRLNSAGNPDICKTKCKSYIYAGWKNRWCLCRNATYVTSDWCTKSCEVSSDKATNVYPCGSNSASAQFYNLYVVNPQRGEIGNCVQLSKGLLSTTLYDLKWMPTTKLIKMQSNVCGSESPVLCEIDNFDHCNSKEEPCKNGGSCSNQEFTYVCNCQEGFTGYFCETNVDECLSSPCFNNATCEDKTNYNLCHCLPGYTGVNCETDIDECSSVPCQHNSTCIDNVNGVTCLCQSGLTGQWCEEDLNECKSSPCVNGVCHDKIDRFLCQCEEGYEGLFCQTELNECIVNGTEVCDNGAVCDDMIADFKCHCPLGFTGRHCETEINECGSSPCQNGGTCHDLINKFECQCPDGFDNRHCSNNIDECGSGPCQNNAICIDKINAYECRCLAGFDGLHCEQYLGNPGEWENWQEWSDCTASCDEGIQQRTRQCTPFFPELGAANCPGDESQSKACMEKTCGPVDGEWGMWQPQGLCSTTCGPGIVNAIRSCDSPSPANNGSDCPGSRSRKQLCENKPCPVYSLCAEWSEWSECQGPCEASDQSQHRWCFTKDLSDLSYLQNNRPYFDRNTNESLSVKEERILPCVKQECKTTALQCSTCTLSFIDREPVVSNCEQSVQCSDDDDVCKTSYVHEDNTVYMRKSCGKSRNCPTNLDRNCQQLKHLAAYINLRVDDVYALRTVWKHALLMWKNLQSMCTLCCHGDYCNNPIIPSHKTLV